MALESGTYINSLNANNPTATDKISQGDDHLRLLKSTILNTFSAITGEVTATHTELNYCDGVTSNIQTQLDAKLSKTISTTQRVIARDTAGSGDAEEVAITDILDWLGTTRGNILYRGASSWSVLSLGANGTFLKSDGTDASWATGGVLTNLVQGQSVGTGTTYTVSSIPTGVEKIEVVMTGVSSDTNSNNLRMQLGYSSGTYQTTGYTGTVQYQNVSGTDWSSHANLDTARGASNTVSVFITLTHCGSNKWQIQGTTISTADNNSRVFGGYVTNGGVLDALQFSFDSGASFDGGDCTVNYYG